jgi:hypothetical protein
VWAELEAPFRVSMDGRFADGTRAYRRVATPAPVSGRRVISLRAGSANRDAPNAALRGTLDIIVQSAAVELFHENGLAVAPLASCPVESSQRYHQHVALLNFAGPGFTGALTLSIPDVLFESRASEAGRTPAGVVDWLAELSNQLFGRVKDRLAVFQLRLKPQLPIGMNGPVLERLRKRTSTQLLYRFRTVRGDILVTLDAPLNDVTLAYSGAAEVAHAGDIILF